jgi:hypothetical protein
MVERRDGEVERGSSRRLTAGRLLVATLFLGTAGASDRVALWAKTLDEKGIALAPTSALALAAGERKGAAR